MAEVLGNITFKRRAGDQGHLGFGPALQRHVDTQAAAIAKAWSYELTYDSKARAHVITGKMKKSIKQKRTGPMGWKVEVGAFYGIYEEFGTRYREGHPFFSPAAKQATRKAIKRHRNSLKTGPGKKIRL